MRRRTLLIGGVVLMIFIGIIAWQLSAQPSKIGEPFRKSAVNIQDSQLIGDELYFFTGSSFARLNTQTGASETLSSYFYTRGQINIASWSSKAVIFSVDEIEASDTFGKAALASGSDPLTIKWWRYDFSSRQLQPLSFSQFTLCQQVAQLGTQLYCLAPYKASAHGYILYSFDLSTGDRKELVHTKDTASSLTAMGNKLYYLITDLDGAQSLSVYTLEGTSSKTIYASNENLEYGTDGKKILVHAFLPANDIPASEQNKRSESSASDGKLLFIDGDGTIIKQVSIPSDQGHLSASYDGMVFSNGNRDIYAAQGTNIKHYVLDKGEIDRAWFIRDSLYYIDDSDQLFTTKAIKTLKSGAEFKESLNTPPNKFFVSAISKDKNTAYLNDGSLDFSANAGAVADFLSSKGYDPNQFNFDWQLIKTSDSPSVPAADSIQ